MGLAPLPSGFGATRESLHRVAEQIVAAARKPHNEIALTATPGGFGTPPFEFDGRLLQVRVEGIDLVVSEDGAERRTELVSLADAASFVGERLFFGGAPSDEAPLELERAAGERLGEFYAFAATALDAARAGSAIGDEPSAIILWPEHFDLAFEAGTDDSGGRATYGASPGDEQHREPYLYVLPWRARRASETWNATGFAGAELGYAELVGTGNPAALAAGFFDDRRAALAR